MSRLDARGHRHRLVEFGRAAGEGARQTPGPPAQAPLPLRLAHAAKGGRTCSVCWTAPIHERRGRRTLMAGRMKLVTRSMIATPAAASSSKRISANSPRGMLPAIFQVGKVQGGDEQRGKAGKGGGNQRCVS